MTWATRHIQATNLIQAIKSLAAIVTEDKQVSPLFLSNPDRQANPGHLSNPGHQKKSLAAKVTEDKWVSPLFLSNPNHMANPGIQQFHETPH
jgi:hypothetical protein